MQLQDLFKIQEILESDIVMASGIREDGIGDTNGSQLRRLALIVKTAELANLTKCYKFGHVKLGIEEDKLIKRYADCMGLLLSIGNHHNFNIINEDAVNRVVEEGSLPQRFIKLFESITKLGSLLDDDQFIEGLNHYIHLFTAYVALGSALGFSQQDMFGYYDQYAKDLEHRLTR